MTFLRVLACVALALAVPAMAADPYPSKPIRMIVPYPAGGVADVSAERGVDELDALGRAICWRSSANRLSVSPILWLSAVAEG